MFELRIGGNYLTRDGSYVTITELSNIERWPFWGSNDISYDESGSCGYGLDNKNGKDIISELFKGVDVSVEYNDEESEVNHPSHYTQGGIECIDAIQDQLTPEEFRGFLKGNVAKYLWREREKQGNVSLEKAQWYLNKLLSLENG